MKIGFDNDKYLELQAQHIRERMSQFGGKLYLEFGGKLFDDYPASAHRTSAARTFTPTPPRASCRGSRPTARSACSPR